MSFWRKHSLSVITSIAFHVAIVGALAVGFRFAPKPRPAARATPIEAVVIDEGAVEREIARMDEADRAEIARREEEERQAREAAEREQQRLAELERQREAAEQAEQQRQAALLQQRERDEAERVAREAAAEDERQRLAALERQRQEAERRAAEEERQRQEEARRRREEEERVARERAAEEERKRREAEEAARKQAELEAETLRVAAAEEEARAAREAGLLDEYLRNIENRIQQRWNKPPSAQPGIECIVKVTQIISGDVTSVEIGQCNGDDAVKRSIEAAVLSASPLPRPPVPSLFNRNLTITFKPDS